MPYDCRYGNYHIPPSKIASMTPENAERLLGYMRNAGRDLEGRLPDSIDHPGGRNPYAHVALCVKRRFGASYKDIDDSLLESVMEYIDQLVEDPR